MKKRLLKGLCLALCVGVLSACSAAGVTMTAQTNTAATTAQTSKAETSAVADMTELSTVSATQPQLSGKLLLAAAASLEKVFRDQLIPLFQKEHPGIVVEGSYDSSGKLQTQIEGGLAADLFMSAAPKQMNALVEENWVDKASVVSLLENEIVLIVPAAGESSLKEFSDITQAKTIALGDPKSVPVGQYSEEALTSLGLWAAIQDQVSWGSNVTEVLTWVAQGSAEAGIVYATDAASSKEVKVVAKAPEGSLKKKVIYPVGLLSASQNKAVAALFLDFLQSDAARKIFEAVGFRTLR